MYSVVLKLLIALLGFLVRLLWIPLLGYIAIKFGIDRWQFKECPSCAEKIRKSANVCKYCNREVDLSNESTKQ